MKIHTPTNSTLEDIEERVKQEDVNAQDLFYEGSQKKSPFKILVYLTLLGLLFVFIGESKSFQNFIKQTEKNLSVLYQQHNIIFWGIVFVSQFFGSITSVPTHVITSVVTYYIVRNFFKCFMFLFSVSLFGTFICYWIYKAYYDTIFKGM